ncbi:hypothetical protein PV08_07343 [Exophiala spinifera]|uniref:Uncharacterized protein n=1 Tax=Exophiala spinifera TaxID=91928 RepID=A0A0D2BTK9_9EURO|nr:uncharacterized protein PV08_07343 [Exophiala spinifera]KIW14559.1 hypothetical protein PV08_07343 [Exophiala spinifera]
MEEFAQSRGDDDLFDDEIVPLDDPPSPEKVAAGLDQVSLDSTPPPPPPPPPPRAEQTPINAPSTVPAPAPENKGYRNNKPRGRGGRGGAPRGGGGAQSRGGLSDSKWAPKPSKPTDTTTVRKSESGPTSEARPDSTATNTAAAPASASTSEAPNPELSTQAEAGAENPTTTAPNAPSIPTNTRPPAVRGDRSATGGTRKPKLTEEELTAKLAAAKERSQNLAAAHARAQADAANFEERERIAKQKREKERVERKVMDNEREKNRQRKMAVMGGREWDAGKNEEDFKANGRGGPRRGYQTSMTPEQQYQAEQDDLRQYEWHENRGRGGGRGRERGRGGRGRGGGGARGGKNAGGPPPDLAADADFPALPTTVAADGEDKMPKASTVSKPTMSRWDSGALSPSGDGGGGGGSWAEQVESSEADNKKENTVAT